jgi:hypothetical protein
MRFWSLRFLTFCTWRSYSVSSGPIWCGLSRCTPRSLLRGPGIRQQESLRPPRKPTTGCVDTCQLSLRIHRFQSCPVRRPSGESATTPWRPGQVPFLNHPFQHSLPPGGNSSTISSIKRRNGARSDSSLFVFSSVRHSISAVCCFAIPRTSAWRLHCIDGVCRRFWFPVRLLSHRRWCS